MLAGMRNNAWMLLCRSEAGRFQRATICVRATQELRLREILAANASSEFGRCYGFAGIRDAREFRERVPLSTYEDYREAVARIAGGEAGVLTSERVRLLEPTSGTGEERKLIPYTKSLSCEFQRGLAAWMHNLLQERPALRRGRAYWSISPTGETAERSPGGIPVGFDDDASYLGGLGQRVVAPLLVQPPGIARVEDMDAFRYLTLLWLLRAEDLTLISVWSPTFLTALFEQFPEWEDRLIRDVERGTANAPGELPGDVAQAMKAASRPDGRRAQALRAILGSQDGLEGKLGEVWPRLGMISCWTDASAAMHLPALRALFPNVEIQPKGLLATEGIVSIPLAGRTGAALALRSHFLEFEECGGKSSQAEARGTMRLAHELEMGGHFRVVVTTGGGLYRYQMRDEVEVVGFENGCPLIRFMGKADQVSDLVGEKLSETQVRGALERVFARLATQPAFAIVAPSAGAPPHYCLYLELKKGGHVDATALGAALQNELESNFHYRHAIRLRQLAPIAVLEWDDSKGLRATYEKVRLATGQKLGAIKPLALEKRGDVARTLSMLSGLPPPRDAIPRHALEVV